jgi:outer membrane lipoprotein-sorting protein
VKSKFLLIALLARGAFAAPTEGLPLTDVLSRVEAAQQSLQDVQFDFVESWSGTPAQVPPMRGRFTFKKPHFLRIDEKKPDEQTIVSDGEHLEIYTPAAEQKLEGSWKKYLQSAQLPLPLLTFTNDFSVSSWSTEYDVLFGGHENGLYRLDFRPKSKNVEPLTLWISDETFLPRRGEIRRPAGLLRVEMSNLRQNISVGDSSFHLKIPKGTAVVPLGS